jgi:hypothetical protein
VNSETLELWVGDLHEGWQEGVRERGELTRSHLLPQTEHTLHTTAARKPTNTDTIGASQAKMSVDSPDPIDNGFVVQFCECLALSCSYEFECVRRSALPLLTVPHTHRKWRTSCVHRHSCSASLFGPRIIPTVGHRRTHTHGHTRTRHLRCSAFWCWRRTRCDFETVAWPGLQLCMWAQPVGSPAQCK